MMMDNARQSSILNFRKYIKGGKCSRKINAIRKIIGVFFTARHLLLIVKWHGLFSTDTLPFDFYKLIESIQSYNFETITDENISTLTSITVSCIGFAGYSMPSNLQSDIIKYLKKTIISQENKMSILFSQCIIQN